VSPRGRRPVGADTRGEIVAAARIEFAAKGYDATSLRAIARRAGVDPALIHHYFSGKAALFATVMAIPIDPSVIVAGLLHTPREQIGAAMVRSFFAIWDQPPARERMQGLMRSAITNHEAGRMLREFLTGEVFTRVTAEMDARVPTVERPTSTPEIRGGLAAAQMVGVAIMRYVIEYGPVVDAGVEELVALLGPTLQTYVAPPPGS